MFSEAAAGGGEGRVPCALCGEECLAMAVCMCVCVCVCVCGAGTPRDKPAGTDAADGGEPGSYASPRQAFTFESEAGPRRPSKVIAASAGGTLTQCLTPRPHITPVSGVGVAVPASLSRCPMSAMYCSCVCRRQLEERVRSGSGAVPDLSNTALGATARSGRRPTNVTAAAAVATGPGDAPATPSESAPAPVVPAIALPPPSEPYVAVCSPHLVDLTTHAHTQTHTTALCSFAPSSRTPLACIADSICMS